MRASPERRGTGSLVASFREPSNLSAFIFSLLPDITEAIRKYPAADRALDINRYGLVRFHVFLQFFDEAENLRICTVSLRIPDIFRYRQQERRGFAFFHNVHLSVDVI